MKMLLLLVALLPVLNCGHVVNPPSSVQQWVGSANCFDKNTGKAIPCADAFTEMKIDAPPKDWIVEWKRVAKERKLYFRIMCADFVPEGNDCSFIGYAWQHPGDDRYYVEDGGKPHWASCGKTQQEAARQLVSDIESPPNFQPQSRVKEKPHRQCVPPITGAPDKGYSASPVGAIKEASEMPTEFRYSQLSS